jgi:hypothetical protein
LAVLKQIFVREPPAGARPVIVMPATQIVLILLALCVILFGCAPDLLVSKLLLAYEAATRLVAM